MIRLIDGTYMMPKLTVSLPSQSESTLASTVALGPKNARSILRPRRRQLPYDNDTTMTRTVQIQQRTGNNNVSPNYLAIHAAKSIIIIIVVIGIEKQSIRWKKSVIIIIIVVVVVVVIIIIKP